MFPVCFRLWVKFLSPLAIPFVQLFMCHQMAVKKEAQEKAKAEQLRRAQAAVSNYR